MVLDKYTPFQIFIFDDQKYLLEHEIEVSHIQALMPKISNYTILEHTSSKRPNTLYNDLMGALENKKEVFENMMTLQRLPLDVVFKLIMRALSKMINYFVKVIVRILESSGLLDQAYRRIYTI